MIRRILPPLILLLALLIDTSVVPMITGGWLVPMIAYTSVLSLGLLQGRTRGALYGLAIGLALDIAVSLPVGLMTVLYALGGFTAGFAGRKLRRNLLSTVLAPLICLTVFEMCMLAYGFVAGSAFMLSLVPKTMGRILLNVLIVQAEYLAYGALLKPKAKRYETR